MAPLGIFFASSPYGRYLGMTAKLLLLLALSLQNSIMIGGLVGVEPAAQHLV